MKVEFSSTRLHSITPNRNINTQKTKNITPNFGTSERLGPVVRISFKGLPEKQANQFASFSAEDKELGLKIYNKGGEAVVVQEASNSFGKHLGADVRGFLPYHAPDNNEGKIKVITGLQVDSNGNPIHTYSTKTENIKTEAPDYVLKKGEAFIVQDTPNDGVSKYLPLERTEIKGTIKQLSENALELEDVDYSVFKVIPQNPKQGVTKYLIHTAEIAKTPSAYATAKKTNPDAYVAGADNLYATVSRIFAKILPNFDNEVHGNFNPANIMLHDRQAYPSLVEMTELSSKNNKYYRGLKSHSIFHNPGRDYQGFFEDGLAFLRLIATEDVMKEVKKLPQYNELVEIDNLRRNSTNSPNKKVPDAKIKKANEILAPIINRFKDELGTYNMTKIAIEAVRENPNNTSLGTVSLNYEKEMLSEETKEISRGLTKTLADLKKLYPNSVISVTNGSTPANLKLNDKNADFGVGGNGLSSETIKQGYTPYKLTKNGKFSIKQVLGAKKANTQWLLNIISEAAKEPGSDNKPSGLQKLFFNNSQIENGASILGELSEYQKGDKLIMGWGRPDAQKGMPATMEAFLKFLKSPDVSTDVKKQTKLIAGAGVWDKEHRDWKNIQRIVQEIQELDGGSYAKNVMYVNGFFPNRLASAATYSIFTSVFEPCGITPLESYAAGSPVINIKTGGAPNFIEDGVSGFLTKNPYLRNPEAVGKKIEDAADEIDDARRNAITEEVFDCIKKAVGLSEKDYNKMANNALHQRVDWHENAAYNEGKCANLRYAEDIYELNVDQKGKINGFAKQREISPMKKLVSFAQDTIETVKETVKEAKKEITEAITNAVDNTTQTAAQTTQTIATETTQAVANETPQSVVSDTVSKATKSAKSTSWGKVLLAIAGIGAAGYGAMVYVKKQKATPKTPTSQPQYSTQPYIKNNIPTVFNKIA